MFLYTCVIVDCVKKSRFKMQLTPTYREQKRLGIHPDTQLNVVRIPENAPEEVRQIMDVKVSGVGRTSMTSKLDPQIQLEKQLEIASKLKERRYNPLDYKLDTKELNLRLQLEKAKRDYKRAFDTIKPANSLKEPDKLGELRGLIVQLTDQINECPLVKQRHQAIKKAFKGFSHYV